MNVVIEHNVRTVGDLVRTLRQYNQDMSLVFNTPLVDLVYDAHVRVEGIPDNDCVVLTIEKAV